MPLGRDRRRQADRQRHICFATAESLAMPGFAAVCQITKHRLTLLPSRLGHFCFPLRDQSDDRSGLERLCHFYETPGEGSVLGVELLDVRDALPNGLDVSGQGGAASSSHPRTA